MPRVLIGRPCIELRLLGGNMRRPNLPGLSKLADLGISTKLGLIVAVLALPICALVFLQYQDRQSATSQADSEAQGLDFVAAVMPFMREVQLHRGLVERVLAGEESAKSNMQRTAESADAALLAITALDEKWGEELKTKHFVAFLNTEWPRARDARGSTVESNALHNTVIEQGVFPLITTASIQSELVLDPDLDNRNVIVALTETLPRLTESLSLMRATGAGALSARKSSAASDETKQYLAGQMAVANFQAEKLSRELETAMKENPQFEAALRPILTRAATTRGVFMDNTNREIIGSVALSPTGAETYFLLGGSSIDLSNQLLTEAQTALNSAFDARADEARTDFATYGALAGLGIILALGLAVFISATITRPMTHLAEVADRMSLGELDVEIDVNGNNEIGQLAESLRRMQSSLRSAIERLRMRRAA